MCAVTAEVDFCCIFGFNLQGKAKKSSAGTKIPSDAVFGDAFLSTGAILVDCWVPAGAQSGAQSGVHIPDQNYKMRL